MRGHITLAWSTGSQLLYTACGQWRPASLGAAGAEPTDSASPATQRPSCWRCCPSMAQISGRREELCPSSSVTSASHFFRNSQSACCEGGRGRGTHRLPETGRHLGPAATLCSWLTGTNTQAHHRLQLPAQLGKPRLHTCGRHVPRGALILGRQLLLHAVQVAAAVGAGPHKAVAGGRLAALRLERHRAVELLEAPAALPLLLCRQGRAGQGRQQGCREAQDRSSTGAKARTHPAPALLRLWPASRHTGAPAPPGERRPPPSTYPSAAASRGARWQLPGGCAPP